MHKIEYLERKWREFVLIKVREKRIIAARRLLLGMLRSGPCSEQNILTVAKARGIIDVIDDAKKSLAVTAWTNRRRGEMGVAGECGRVALG